MSRASEDRHKIRRLQEKVNRLKADRQYYQQHIQIHKDYLTSSNTLDTGNALKSIYSGPDIGPPTEIEILDMAVEYICRLGRNV